MKSFRDNENREWTITVNVGTVKKVREFCGVNILEIIKIGDSDVPDMKLLEQLSSDPVLLVDVIYVLCKAQTEQRNISAEEFGAALTGDAISAAGAALLDEIADFFPSAKRMILKKAMEATRRFEKEVEKQTMKNIEKIEEEMNLELQKLNGSSANSPESAE